MGVVPGCTLLVGKVSGKGENLPDRGSLIVIWWTLKQLKTTEND